RRTVRGRGGRGRRTGRRGRPTGRAAGRRRGRRRGCGRWWDSGRTGPGRRGRGKARPRRPPSGQEAGRPRRRGGEGPWASRPSEGPLEQVVDVAQVVLDVEAAVDLLGGQARRDVRVLQQQRLEVPLARLRVHGGLLHPAVGLVARHPLLGQLQQDRPGEDQAAAALEVPAHRLGVDDHAGDDPGEAVDHVVEQDGGVRQDDPLGRGVGDVPFVPQRDILERHLKIAPDEPRLAAHLLGGDRVLLVRHRRRALLAGAERLLDLPDLGALQVTHLDGEALDGGGGDRQGGEIFRV